MVTGEEFKVDWIRNYWKNLLIVCLCILLVGVSVNSCILAGRVVKYEGLYIETYRELVVAERALRLNEFENYDAMKTWVQNWVRKKFISLTGIVDTIENITHLILTGKYLWACSDIAEEMARSARMEGYLV